MGHGYQFFSYRSGIPSLLWIIGLSIGGLVILVLFLEWQKRSSPEYRELMEVINNRFAKGEINEDEYYEIKSVLEDEYSKDNAVTELNLRYANGTVGLKDYVVMLDAINEDKKKSKNGRY